MGLGLFGMIDPTNEDWVYLAGIIDGEGSVQISHHPPYNYNVTLSVVNTDKRLIDWMVDRWPAPVHASPRSGRKTCYQWMLHNTHAASILRRVRLHMIVKREQANLALEFLDQKKSYRGRAGIPDEELVMRSDFARAVKEARLLGCSYG